MWQGSLSHAVCYVQYKHILRKGWVLFTLPLPLQDLRTETSSLCYDVLHLPSSTAVLISRGAIFPNLCLSRVLCPDLFPHARASSFPHSLCVGSSWPCHTPVFLLWGDTLPPLYNHPITTGTLWSDFPWAFSSPRRRDLTPSVFLSNPCVQSMSC